MQLPDSLKIDLGSVQVTFKVEQVEGIAPKGMASLPHWRDNLREQQRAALDHAEHYMRHFARSHAPGHNHFALIAEMASMFDLYATAVGGFAEELINKMLSALNDAEQAQNALNALGFGNAKGASVSANAMNAEMNGTDDPRARS